MSNSICLTRIAIALGLLFAGSAAAQSFSKTEQITYHDNTTIWVLGQTATVSCVAAFPQARLRRQWRCESETTYDPIYACR
jgi:hypothetical protein